MKKRRSFLQRKVSPFRFILYLCVMMKMKAIFTLIMMVCCLCSASAQNRLNDFGSSASGRSLGQRDRNGNPIDTTAVTDAKSIPIGL